MSDVVAKKLRDTRPNVLEDEIEENEISEGNDSFADGFDDSFLGEDTSSSSYERTDNISFGSSEDGDTYSWNQPSVDAQQSDELEQNHSSLEGSENSLERMQEPWNGSLQTNGETSRPRGDVLQASFSNGSRHSSSAFEIIDGQISPIGSEHQESATSTNDVNSECSDRKSAVSRKFDDSGEHNAIPSRQGDKYLHDEDSQYSANNQSFDSEDHQSYSSGDNPSYSSGDDPSYYPKNETSQNSGGEHSQFSDEIQSEGDRSKYFGEDEDSDSFTNDVNSQCSYRKSAVSRNFDESGEHSSIPSGQGDNYLDDEDSQYSVDDQSFDSEGDQSHYSKDHHSYSSGDDPSYYPKNETSQNSGGDHLPFPDEIQSQDDRLKCSGGDEESASSTNDVNSPCSNRKSTVSRNSDDSGEQSSIPSDQGDNHLHDEYSHYSADDQSFDSEGDQSHPSGDDPSLCPNNEILQNSGGDHSQFSDEIQSQDDRLKYSGGDEESASFENDVNSQCSYRKSAVSRNFDDSGEHSAIPSGQGDNYLHDEDSQCSADHHSFDSEGDQSHYSRDDQSHYSGVDYSRSSAGDQTHSSDGESPNFGEDQSQFSIGAHSQSSESSCKLQQADPGKDPMGSSGAESLKNREGSALHSNDVSEILDISADLDDRSLVLSENRSTAGHSFVDSKDLSCMDQSGILRQHAGMSLSHGNHYHNDTSTGSVQDDFTDDGYVPGEHNSNGSQLSNFSGDPFDQNSKTSVPKMAGIFNQHKVDPSVGDEVNPAPTQAKRISVTRSTATLNESNAESLCLSQIDNDCPYNLHSKSTIPKTESVEEPSLWLSALEKPSSDEESSDSESESSTCFEGGSYCEDERVSEGPNLRSNSSFGHDTDVHSHASENQPSPIMRRERDNGDVDEDKSWSNRSEIQASYPDFVSHQVDHADEDLKDVEESDFGNSLPLSIQSEDSGKVSLLGGQTQQRERQTMASNVHSGMLESRHQSNHSARDTSCRSYGLQRSVSTEAYDSFAVETSNQSATLLRSSQQTSEPDANHEHKFSVNIEKNDQNVEDRTGVDSGKSTEDPSNPTPPRLQALTNVPESTNTETTQLTFQDFSAHSNKRERIDFSDTAMEMSCATFGKFEGSFSSFDTKHAGDDKSNTFGNFHKGDFFGNSEHSSSHHKSTGSIEQSRSNRSMRLASGSEHLIADMERKTVPVNTVSTRSNDGSGLVGPSTPNQNSVSSALRECADDRVSGAEASASHTFALAQAKSTDRSPDTVLEDSADLSSPSHEDERATFDMNLSSNEQNAFLHSEPGKESGKVNPAISEQSLEDGSTDGSNGEFGSNVSDSCESKTLSDGQFGRQSAQEVDDSNHIRSFSRKESISPIRHKAAYSKNEPSLRSFSGSGESAASGGKDEDSNSFSLERSGSADIQDDETSFDRDFDENRGKDFGLSTEDEEQSQESDIDEAQSLRLPRPKTYGGYNRDQIAKLGMNVRSFDDTEGNKKILRDLQKNESLLSLVSNVHESVEGLVKVERDEKAAKIIDPDQEEQNQENEEFLTSTRLILAFESFVGVLLQLSDELELLQTFSRARDSPAIEAIGSLLSFCQPIDEIYAILKPVLLHYLIEEIDEELDDFLYGMNLLVDLLCEFSSRVGERQQWSPRAATSLVTMIELLARDTLEVTCIYEDVDTPEYDLSYRVQDAWEATGHVEEIKTLMVTSDLFMFRQICYEVLLSTDQWCPDNNTLMDICGVDDESEGERENPNNDDMLSPSPEAAIQILEKIHKEPLQRTAAMASVLRRLLPAQAITDPSISENFARIRNTVRNPLGLPPSSLVTITSISESPGDPEALGVAGVGKSTIAAMVADHHDVRRFFVDGIAWIYVGETELTYNRYAQCLQDMLVQLEVDEDEEPLFPELLHSPGESYAVRRRREEGFMIYLRETMVEFLKSRNVLIVLDDVCFEPDLDWFDFSPAPTPTDADEDEEGCCAILVTSRRRTLLPPADTVEVDMLEQQESIELLMREAGELSKALTELDSETTAVALECACHPLTIKSVGRWLNLKHAGVMNTGSIDEIQNEVRNSIDHLIKKEAKDDHDMLYSILQMSLSPAINGEPTKIIKLCFAGFVRVFCDRRHISDFALADSTPIIPLATTHLFFEALLDLEEEALRKEGSLFVAKKAEAAALIPEALSALGIFKMIITYAESTAENEEVEDEKYIQIMHSIQEEYGTYLFEEDETMTDLARDGEIRWNESFAKAFMNRDTVWDAEAPDASVDYALEMLPSHLLRAGMYSEAWKLLCDEAFAKGRLFALGRENGTRRQIKDCESLFDILSKLDRQRRKKTDPRTLIKTAYSMIGGLLQMDEEEYMNEEGSPEAVEVGRCHFELGFSLAEKRCWDGAIYHWEQSQEFLVSALGMVELVAGILYSVGSVYCEMHEYEQALGSLKQCLRIRGAIHGEEHILYAQTIQKIGDIFLAMSDYHEAMESFNWALDVMHIEPSHHRIAIGDILEQMGKIHYCKGEIDESLQCFQDSLRSKQVDLGEDHPELATLFHSIGNCLSNQGKTDESIAHLEEAIRLKKLDPDGGFERDSDVLTIQGILDNLNGMQNEGLRCYEQALQILVTKVPHQKEKVASLLHLIGCVYLMGGEHKKAMKLFEESLHARRKILGFVHLDVASTLFNMAFLYQTRNRLDKALKCLEEALKIRELRLPNSEKVAVTHEKIGNLARGIGKTKKAENAFADALRIRKVIHGNNHEAVATVLQELGDLMDDLGQYEDAMKHYVEALEIRESRLGPDDLAVAETYYSMGFTLQNNGALDRALQCLEESLSIRKFQLGDDAKEVGDTLNMLGFLQAKRGELDDALSLLWDALRTRKLQDDHIKVSETLNNIGNVHREKQEFDLALECYEECLRIRRNELGDGNEKVADALIAIGNVQSDMGFPDDAMDSYKEALAIRNMLFGEQDESVASVLQFMGTLEFRANELDRAFQLLDEFVRIRQENGTELDGDYVNVLFMIGNIHKMQENEAEARKCWTEAYGVFKKLGLAETNPQIAEIMSTLVKDEEVDTTVGDDRKSKGVFDRITAKVKNAARTANEAGNAVKKVTGMKGQDRGSQLL